MIGIDVGGANLKVVDEDGVHIHYCPLWKDSPLRALLREYGSTEAAVVMSGELADCFSSRMEGISFIVDEVRKAVPGAVFYGMDGRFHERAVPELAAANWLASADFLREAYPRAVLVDMGSTTTDIIPLSPFSRLLGLTDLGRLQKGYLVYTGLLRTNVAAILQEVIINGIPTPVSSEFFAQSADAHRVLGTISASGYSVPTPDGADTSREASLRRLARVVCTDTEEIGEQGVYGIAEQVWKAQRAALEKRINAAVHESGADTVLAAGIGSKLLTGLCGAHELRSILECAQDALPAYAVREVYRRITGH
ncbi:MAG: H4MPT-linked C1 transfer pathway protein [Methanomicrobiaceae archaeon]|nr:H4MPT-linked C1 transfer pathway protein [Methanomicrobiaceae archaeon]